MAVFYYAKNLNEMEEINMNDNTPVYNWEDAIKFITERCNLSEDVIIEVLELEEEYMKSVGIIVEEE